jgi:hypothetical protein
MPAPHPIGTDRNTFTSFQVYCQRSFDNELALDAGSLKAVDLKKCVHTSTLVSQQEIAAGPSVRSPGAPFDLMAPLRPKHLRELSHLGVSKADYECFLGFVGHPFDFITRSTQPHGRWTAAAGGQSLTHAILLAHLRGERWAGTGARWNAAVGARGRHQTNYFVLDLDHGTELQDRYLAVRDALGTPSLLFQSSDRGGLHAYYFLSSPVDLFRLQDSRKTGGAVIRLLVGAELEMAPGRIEFYPTGKLKDGPRGNRLRLPFGAQSELLDERGHRRRTDVAPLRDLHDVSTAFAEGRVKCYEFAELFERAQSSRASRRMPTARPSKRAIGGNHGTHAAADVVTLLETGLTGPGQFNRSVSALVYKFRRDCLSEEETVRRVVAWLGDHHNGFSTTYSDDPAVAHAEIERIAKRVYARPGDPTFVKVELPPLTPREVQTILAATMAGLCVDPQTGEELSLLAPA